MREMKEKLEKNHYKGFDRRAKMVSIIACSSLLVALGVFLPLTAAMQTKVYQAEAQAKVENPDETQAQNNVPAKKVLLTFAQAD
ncbi:MAG: hypothetical protein LKJ88_04670 [Bacilli bacterium]|jgi:hypothetical protein|nr:hypothetical protein [Bacilli bacterium]